MDNNKSPGNYGLSKELYVKFWGKLNVYLFQSLLQGKRKGELSTSQRQAVIKLLEKKGRDKRLIKNWRPISLLNVDAKLLTKTLANKMKNVLPNLIKSDQTAYVANRFIGESARLISDIIEMTKKLNIGGYLLTVDIEKAFDSMDHTFLFAVLEKFGFGESFIQWIRVILKNQESCVINGGKTTGYFSLYRGARQGDPISAYLFILVLEIVFISIRSNGNIKGIKIFGNSYKLTAFADDTTFFIKNKESVECLLESFQTFSKFSGLKPNASKCEICGIGTKRGEYVALCGMKQVNLNSASVKILGIHFSYDENVIKEKNFLEIIKMIENIVHVWKMRNLTIMGKITIFKTIILSKIVYITFLSNIPKIIIDKLENIQKTFLWDGKRPKIKHTTLIGSYEKGGLNGVDIKSRLCALQLSWIRRLFDNNDHAWKLIPNYLIKKHFGNKEFFFPNCDVKIPDELPLFYRNMILLWCKVSYCKPVTATCVYTQRVWHNIFIQINNTSIFYKQFAHKGVFFVKDFYNGNGELQTWEEFRQHYDCLENMYFTWRQIVGSIPVSWKQMINNDKGNTIHSGIYDQHLIRVTRQLTIAKMTSKEFYNIMIANVFVKPTSERTLTNLLNIDNINWSKIYTLSGEITLDTYSRMFMFKLNHNILYLNKSLTRMGILNNSLCSFCNISDETPLHLFYECNNSTQIWSEMQLHFRNTLHLPDLTPQSALLGFFELVHDRVIINHLLLIFKITLYNNRKNKNCILQNVLGNISKIKNIESEITLNNERQHNFHLTKWANVF